MAAIRPAIAVTAMPIPVVLTVVSAAATPTVTTVAAAVREDRDKVKAKVVALRVAAVIDRRDMAAAVAGLMAVGVVVVVAAIVPAIVEATNGGIRHSLSDDSYLSQPALLEIT